jgi:hypothetical protein
MNKAVSYLYDAVLHQMLDQVAKKVNGRLWLPRIVHAPDGKGCLRACLASLFGLDFSEAPAFSEDRWIDELDVWLKERFACRWPADHRIPHIEILLSPCGKRSHAVLMLDGLLVFDPSAKNTPFDWSDWDAIMIIDHLGALSFTVVGGIAGARHEVVARRLDDGND